MTADSEHVGPGTRWGREHRRQLIALRILLVPWIAFITTFLCIKGYWWALLFIPIIGYDLWLLRGLLKSPPSA